VNNYHNNWYVFINAPSGQASNIVPNELGHTPADTQSTDTSTLERITRPFAGAVAVTEMTAHECQERLKILIAGRTEQRP